MRLTLRLKNDDYLDISLDVKNRVLTFINPVPDIDLQVLSEFADKYRYAIHFPITEEALIPDITDFTSEELFKDFQAETQDVIEFLLILANYIISEG